MATTQKKKKKFTVGLWIDLKTSAGEPLGLQMWSLQDGDTGGEGLQWHTVVEAVDSDAAFKLGQDIYSGKVPIVEQDTQAEAA